MSETAPRYLTKPTPADRMRGATRHACALAVELLNSGSSRAAALAEAGISQRSLDRYLKAAAPVEKPPGGGQQPPAPLPLFDVHERLAQVEARVQALDEYAGRIDRRLVRAAELLNDVAHEMADWPKA